MILMLLGWALAILLAVSACGKALNFPGFAAVLRNTYRIPVPLARPLALAVPAAEIGVAWLLVADTQLGLVSSLFLFAVILAAVIAAKVRGGSGDCGCLGSIRPEPLSGRTVIKLCGLLLANALAVTWTSVSGPQQPLVVEPLGLMLTFLGIGLLIAIGAFAAQTILQLRHQ